MTIFISNSSLFLKIFFVILLFFSLSSCETLSQQDKLMYNKASSSVKEGEIEKGVELYQELLKKNPKYDKARYNLTLLLIGKKDWKSVTDELSFLQARMPSNARIAKLKAFALFEEGREKESLELYQALVKRLPMDSEILYNLAYLIWHMNHDAKGAGFYLKRLEANRGSVNLKDKAWFKDLANDRTP